MAESMRFDIVHVRKRSMEKTRRNPNPNERACRGVLHGENMASTMDQSVG